jgi:hypothetical protein
VTRSAFALFALVALLAMGIRLYGLEGIGVGGNDTILYYTLAESWARGEPVYRIGDSVQVFRPVLLAFNALALRVLGHEDYAIKLANCLLDGLNLLLVAALAWQASRRAAVVVASAATYAFLPLAIWSARQELPHTLSTTLVLLACLLACRAALTGSDRPVPGGLALSGLALMAATLVHEELVLLALPMALFFLLGSRAAGLLSPRSTPAALAALAVFPLLGVALVLVYQGERVGAVLQPAAGNLWSAVALYPERAARLLWNGVVGASSSLFALACGLALLSCLWVSRGGRDRDLRYRVAGGMCLGVPAAFIALYALFFETVFPRALLPLMPLLIVGVYSGADRRLAAGVAALLVLVFTVSSLASYSAFKVGNRRFGTEWAAPDWPTARRLERGYREFLVDARYVPSYATHWRRIYDALGHRIDREHRLLVTPSTVIYSAGRRALQTEVYLGDNAIYRLDHFDEPLERLVRERNIKFVLFTLGQRRGPPSRQLPYRYDGEWGAPRPVDLAGAYGLSRYSVQGEFRELAEALAAMGARPITPFPPGSLEAGVARVWQLP